MSLANLMETLVGTVWLPSVSDLLEYRSEESEHVLSFRVPQGRQQVVVAPDGLRVLRVEIFNLQGSCVLMKTFDDHRVVDGIVRPGRVRIVLPDREEELQLTFTHQEINRPMPEREFELDLPAQVEVVPLDLE
jgi:hypothetical protein